jgi:hypothetical protein
MSPGDAKLSWKDEEEPAKDQLEQTMEKSQHKLK